MASIHIGPSYMIAAGALWPPVCATVIALRFATRRSQRAPLGVDDWLTIPALLALLGMGIMIIAGTAMKGFGYRTPVLGPNEALMSISPQQRITKIGYYVLCPLQILALTCIKLSAILFYRRVFRTGGNKAIDITILIIVAIISVWGLGYFFSLIFLCGTKISLLYGSVDDLLQCSGNSVTEQMSMAVSDVITDFIVLIFPIPLIWRLQMSTRNKIAVMGIFFLGATAITASIVRLVIFVQALSAEFKTTTDTDLLSTAGAYCMMMEVSLALCAICLPSLSGVFKLKGVQTLLAGFQSVFSNLSRSRGSQTSFRPKEGEQSSSRSASKHSVYREIQEPDIELHPLPTSSAIRVTNEFSVAREEGS